MLLNQNPLQRLGGSKEDAREVKKHVYFNGVDWEALLAKKYNAPFIPEIV